jgi:hypothetical protein
MLRNYKELKVWEKSYQLCLEVYKKTMGYLQNDNLTKLQGDLGEVERMLKALIKPLADKPLTP